MIAIKIELNPHLYVRDPQETKLGKKIIEASIVLIDKLGFEKFTFKKLALEIQSTEASIYRYFKNKHKLLIYLVSWYWEWMNFQIGYNTMNMQDAQEQLKVVLSVLVESSQTNPAISYVDEHLLHRIVVSESSKVYRTKQVDKQNEKGYFDNYENLCKTIAAIILQKKSNYLYPLSLASTLVEMANNSIYFAKHIPSLTDSSIKGNQLESIKTMLQHFAFAAINS